jgi:glycosyltransferase involved in cell wall biosynthesis
MSINSPWSREAAIHISQAGHTVDVVAFSHDRENSYFRGIDLNSPDFKRLQGNVAAVHFLDSRLRSELRYLSSASAVKKLCCRIGADALLTFYGGGLGVMALASGVRPYFVYLVGSDVLLSRGFRRRMTRMFVNSARCVFVNGNYLSEKAIELAPEARIVPLYLGVDTNRFVPCSPQSGPLRVLCTRGFLSVYNNDYLIEALARMPETTRDFLFTFAAGGPLLESSRRLADQLLPPRMRKRVEFLGGVAHERLVEILGSSHVYVSASVSDGTSLSLLEALSCGLFPVLSDIPQNREWIGVNGAKNGILVPFNQPDMLAAALHAAIENDDLRNGVAEYNRTLVQTRGDIGKNMKTLASTLESAVLAEKH